MNDFKDRIPAQRRRRVKGNLATCAMSRKVRYRDHREATRALQRLTTQAMVADELGGAHTIVVKRQYRCTACKGWHLTSWESPTSPGTSARPRRSRACGPAGSEPAGGLPVLRFPDGSA